jgi:hypothetical protein
MSSSAKPKIFERLPSRQTTTMGFGDLLDFDEYAYRAKVKTMTWSELRQREVAKYRQQYSGAAAAGGGIGLAPFTMGISLIGTVYAARCVDIAEQKHDIVVAELKSRGHKLYEPDWKDVVVPGLCGMASPLIGLGIGAAIPTDCLNGAAGNFLTDQTSNTISNVVADPGTLLSHANDGIQGQIDILGGVPLFDGAAPMPTPGDPVATLGTTAGYTAARLAEAFAAGKVISWAGDEMIGKKVGLYSCRSCHRPLTDYPT